MNHNAAVPNPETPPSQRARSLIFVAYGILAATTLNQYHAGNGATLYVCENGFHFRKPAAYAHAPRQPHHPDHPPGATQDASAPA